MSFEIDAFRLESRGSALEIMTQMARRKGHRPLLFPNSGFFNVPHQSVRAEKTGKSNRLQM